ncbi:hypothetical protein F503_05372 [Ophiostoma piceae UAMH 11346]|uniref:Uncharacterized protein n=1 Tax=Ophiostoma piceae (strain UAMH 11346) TaxID=1262450 RepID=S3CBL8_OPHP1|nr:hypothetical protein F503_05372 [Ophiostoma piceae UAMH 11346]
MSTDHHFRIGRGGAGNFFSKKDLEEAEQKDLEAQNGDAPAQPPAPPQPQQSPYTRGGRGGAGNFYDAAAVAAAERDEAVEAARIQSTTTQSSAGPASADSPAVVSPSQPRKSAGTRPMISGRGGAGNWAASNAAAAEAEEEQKRKEAAIAAQIQQDVDAGLLMPPKTYHQAPVTREREK